MILDAGVLVSIDRGERAAQTLLTAMRSRSTTIRTTQPVVAQVWRSRRQARLGQFLRTVNQIVALDDGRNVGRLLERSGATDVVDAHLIACAIVWAEPVLTGDPDDLSRIAAGSGASVKVLPWP